MPDSDISLDICVIGAGVVGLALARELSLACPGRDIVLLERHAQIGQETSSRNSEVIHAGLYYPTGSLKAQSCVRGRELLYRYCEQQGIPYKRIGKLLVADAGETAALETIHQHAQANGVRSLEVLDRQQLYRMEPNVQAHSALWSPDTGIVDSHGLMQSFLREAEAHGLTLALRTELLSAEPVGGDAGFRLLVRSGTQTLTLTSRILINCAGLNATAVARRIHGMAHNSLPTMEISKGNYLAYSGLSPFVHLIYPVPDPTRRGLGIHATLDLAGQCRFGPDIEPVAEPIIGPTIGPIEDSLDYAVSAQRLPAFEQAIRRYYPALDSQRLHPAYSGIRPRLKTAPGVIADFVIQNQLSHGAPGLWQLFGIESPGLTASMALAERVRDEILQAQIL